jgi:predicted metalloprotease with PDZ domain
MNSKSAEKYGFGSYIANDYEELIDHPGEIGELSIGEFEVRGVPHTIAIRGKTRADMARLCHDLQTICDHHMSFLGTPADLDRYLFLLNAPGSGYGGLEHRWSSALICGRDNLPARGDEGVSDEYRTFLGLVSHEYFHLWNVKRMKPAAFTPIDLSQEAHTVRCGMIEMKSYLELLGQTITRVNRSGGRRKQSVAESSFDAWTKFYKQDANAANAIISYYAKGALIALALDLKLRSETQGSCTLDDVMKQAWQRWGETGEGMPEDGLEKLSVEVSGLDLEDFFDATVRGTGELPLETLLKTHGISYNLRRSAGGEDRGGKAKKESELPAVWLGATLGNKNGAPVFTAVHNGGPAEIAGIAPGDELVALDGLRINLAGCETRTRRYHAGDKSEVTVFRGDELMTLRLTWTAAPADTCYLTEDDDVDDALMLRRNAWLAR